MCSGLKFVLCCVFFFLQGVLPPLDAPHHLRKHEWAPYREGNDNLVKKCKFCGEWLRFR